MIYLLYFSMYLLYFIAIKDTKPTKDRTTIMDEMTLMDREREQEGDKPPSIRPQPVRPWRVAVIANVKVVTEQLSAIVAFGTITEALHTPASSFFDIAPGQVIVGIILSVIVTVKLQVALLPAPSLTI